MSHIAFLLLLPLFQKKTKEKEKKKIQEYLLEVYLTL